MSKRIWVLGASDPEMAVIEGLLRKAGETVEYAVHVPGGLCTAVEVSSDARRVLPAETYDLSPVPAGDGIERTYVECAPRVDALDPGDSSEGGHLRCGPNPGGCCTGAHLWWSGQEWQCSACTAVRCCCTWPCGLQHGCGTCATQGPHIIDHHRPGDPGYGKPPAGFLFASSVGQVWRYLNAPEYRSWEWRRYGGGMFLFDGEWRLLRIAGGALSVPYDVVYAAAADHCLGAAYRSECPGVDSDALMKWRVRQRAAHQDRSEESILADVYLARTRLRCKCTQGNDPWDGFCNSCAHPHMRGVSCGLVRNFELLAGEQVADLRGKEIPELPEAAAREGVAYIATPTVCSGERTKVVLGCASPEQVRAFLETWAPAHGLVDAYGDPARGFAGGYINNINKE